LVTDDGSEGWTHSGSATIPEYTYGAFQVIDGKFIPNIVVPLQVQNSFPVFIADGRKGHSGNGVAAEIEGGEPLHAGGDDCWQKERLPTCASTAPEESSQSAPTEFLVRLGK
jgi:hypothetical protein